jgi:hypothetical protein
MSNLPDFLKSRKFWALAAGIIIMVLRHFVPQLPISDDQITSVVYLLVAFIIGTGLEDVGTGYARGAKG